MASTHMIVDVEGCKVSFGDDTVLEEGALYCANEGAPIDGDRANGKLAWEVEMADARQNYGATSAPLGCLPGHRLSSSARA